MALEIKAIPTLSGPAAEQFIAAAQLAERQAALRHPADARKRHQRIAAILRKANMI